MPKSPAPAAPTTRDLLKQQFVSLCQQRDAILKEVAPVRAQRDKMVAQAEAALAAELVPLDASIAQLEAPLAALHQEIAQVVQALGGETA
jgi:uncharacterized coiled-coil DUF342 family protein